MARQLPVKKDLLLLGVALVAGCTPADGSSVRTHRQSERLAEIQARTDGEWGRLSPDDRRFMVEDLAHGSETTAKLLLAPRRQ